MRSGERIAATLEDEGRNGLNERRYGNTTATIRHSETSRRYSGEPLRWRRQSRRRRPAPLEDLVDGLDGIRSGGLSPRLHVAGTHRENGVNIQRLRRFRAGRSALAARPRPIPHLARTEPRSLKTPDPARMRSSPRRYLPDLYGTVRRAVLRSYPVGIVLTLRHRNLFSALHHVPELSAW